MLVFDHGHPAPVEGRQQGCGLRQQLGREGHALAADADTAGRRLFPDSSMRETREHLAAPAQEENAEAGARDSA